MGLAYPRRENEVVIANQRFEDRSEGKITTTVSQIGTRIDATLTDLETSYARFEEGR